MGKCTTALQTLSFDFSDPQVTKVTLTQDFDGDCPLGLKRQYTATFPARISAIDIINQEIATQRYLTEW